MNKTDLVKKLAKVTGLPLVKASEVVDALFDARSGKGIIATELDAGRKVIIPGFGSFFTRRRKAREGRNPATGTTIEISERKAVVFKPSRFLRDAINKEPLHE